MRVVLATSRTTMTGGGGGGGGGVSTGGVGVGSRLSAEEPRCVSGGCGVAALRRGLSQQPGGGQGG